ncbi:MAG: hypothetical protein IT430_07750 [Phycisphaerales bacterium]|nr:hypothetical protein [Phycisphaerales bacterium]
MRRRTLIAGSIVAAGAILLLLLDPTIYTDRAFACEYTCSHMGYREWIFGFSTDEWYKTSPIETRLGGENLKHHWVSYAGDGYGLLHRSRGHGRPHRAAYDTHNYWPYFESLTDEQLRELYEVFQRVEDVQQRQVLDESMEEKLFEFMDAEK